MRQVGEDVVIGSMDTCIESTSTLLEEGERERRRREGGEREGGRGRERERWRKGLGRVNIMWWGPGGRGFSLWYNLAGGEDEDSLASHTWCHVLLG